MGSESPGMISTGEIRQHVSRLVASLESLDLFEDWFVQRSWDIHKSEDIETRQLVYRIELRLAEHSSGHLSEEDLMRELRDLINTVPLRVGVPASANIIRSSGSIGNIIRGGLQQMQPVGKSPLMAFG
jgi:hypothetical protein